MRKPSLEQVVAFLEKHVVWPLLAGSLVCMACGLFALHAGLVHLQEATEASQVPVLVTNSALIAAEQCVQHRQLEHALMGVVTW